MTQDILVDRVTKLWGETAAVAEASFSVQAGQLTALLGPSGCGKSTTLRLLAGLDTPSSGSIHIGGRDVTALEPSQRGIAMVFQSYALFPHLNVAENILFGLRVRKVARAERDERLARAAHLLGLKALLERKPSQLAGGQQQRVALARAIVAEAAVCLMDEPLSNLDAQLRLEMRREIRALQQRLGMTMVYVTHDQVEAMTMADQIILMNGGHIEQIGAPDDLYAHPRTPFAARFIGTPPMNIISATSLVEAPALMPEGASADALVGVRPEAARIGSSGVQARVVAVEYLGADTLIETRLGEASFTIRAPGKRDVAQGQIIHIEWSRAEAHSFDAKTQSRSQT